MKQNKTSCEDCINYLYDEDWADYYCAVDMDEDEAARLRARAPAVCPFYRFRDEYITVRKQN